LIKLAEKDKHIPYINDNWFVHNFIFNKI
jgi:hypothetical protein